MEEGSGKEELQEVQRQKIQAMQEAALREQKTKQVLQNVLTQEAFERLLRIRIADASLYENIVQQVLYYVQTQQFREKISDEVLKQLAAQLSQKRETQIKFMRK